MLVRYGHEFNASCRAISSGLPHAGRDPSISMPLALVYVVSDSIQYDLLVESRAVPKAFRRPARFFHPYFKRSLNDGVQGRSAVTSEADLK